MKEINNRNSWIISLKGYFSFGMGMSPFLWLYHADKMPWTHKLNEIINNMNFTRRSANVSNAPHSINIQELWPRCHDWFMGGFSFATMNYSAEFSKCCFFSPKEFSTISKFRLFPLICFITTSLHWAFASTLLVKYLTKMYIWMRNRMKLPSIHLDHNKNLIIRSIPMWTAHWEHVNRMFGCHYFNNNIRVFCLIFGANKCPFVQAHTHTHTYWWLFTGSVEGIKLIFSICYRVTHGSECVETASTVIFIWEPPLKSFSSTHSHRR